MSPAQQLGPYRLIERIGRGGMGEVWRARDTRLDREVAVKLSAEQFTDRFEREARAIAALNHPNICTLFDVGPNYLVMELIEGPTLADRIAEGPIPLEESLAIARQIADALEAAHEKNIVHRDLKPANIKLRPDGSVKVLDFGLAKAGGPETVVTGDSPTMLHTPTQIGVILGTAAYMAPEQARGKNIDKRADIWAFGVVLHEMVTGKRLFEGEDLTETLASVVKSDPDLTPAPHKVRRLLAKCLQKDPKKRLRDIGDAWELLEDAPQPSLMVAKPSWLWPAIAAAFAAIASAVTWWLTKPAPQTARVVARFSIPLPEGQSFVRPGRHEIAISPDGKRLVYVANQQLYLRNMNELEAKPVQSTSEDPIEPVFSPDGQWLAYFTLDNGPGTIPGGTVLKKIAVAGGAPVTLAQLPTLPSGATWSNEEIAFGATTADTSAIEAVPETGGPPRIIARGDASKEQIIQPQLLPDGKHIMFVIQPNDMATEGQIVVQGLDGKDRRVLVNGGSDPRLLSSGQLIYIHDGTLLAVPFDSRKPAVTGGPVPVLGGVAETTASLTGEFAVSSEGTLVFLPGAADELATPHLMVWVDREGHEQPIPVKPRAYLHARISPDGGKIAVGSNDEDHDIWLFDLNKETLTRLTFGPAWEGYPLWSADGKSLFFLSGRQIPYGQVPSDVHRKAADGTGPEEALTQNGQGGWPNSLTPDGKSLVYTITRTGRSLFLLPLDPKGAPHALLPGAKWQYNADLSPDGRWIAYDSPESGQTEVYVRPFPAVEGGRWQISAEGGSRPVWSRSGRELFFLMANNRMAVVAIQPGGSFTYGKPQPLFDASRYVQASSSRMFDVSADGKRFLMIKPVGSGGDTAAARPSIVVVPNWTEEVKARMAGGR